MRGLDFHFGLYSVVSRKLLHSCGGRHKGMEDQLEARKLDEIAVIQVRQQAPPLGQEKEDQEKRSKCCTVVQLVTSWWGWLVSW